METSHSTSLQRIEQPLPYPNLSLGDRAGFAVANFAYSNDLIPGARKLGLPAVVRNSFLILSLLLGLFFSTLDTSIIATSLITISIEFHDHANAPWILLAYLLTYMGCSVGVAKLSDIYGRRTVLFYSWGIFLTFSAGCTGAPNMPTLIICRAFKGIGGAGLYSLAQICLLEHGPARNPSLMGALIGITLALAFLLGPILGGAITSRVSWRWIFAINIPFGCLATLCILLFFPVEHRAHSILSLKALRKIDFIGMISLLSASVTLVFGIERGGARVYSWDHKAIISSFVVSGISWIVFICWEIHLNKTYCQLTDHRRCRHVEPVFTAKLARRRPYICGLIVAFLTGAPYVVLTVAIPERMQVLQHENPLNAGVHLLPMLTGTAVGSFLAGAICRKHNHTAFLMIMSSAMQVIGVSLMLLLTDVESSFVPAYGFTLIVGLGVGVSFGASTIVAAVEDDKAVAQGAIAQARVLGSCLGLSICTVLFNNRLDAIIQHLTKEQLATLQQTPTASADWPDGLLRRIQEVYIIAFRDQTVFLTCISGIMLVTAICAFERSPKPISSAADAQRALKASQQGGRYDNHGTEMSDMASVRSA
ncbi:MFS multidrug transporter [Colletotrichum truncatum]|uniref:MFS multidrug transporter n=1 Tax=Colletotrichum truncatum TaxID=5467 RepID=A0ACC3Z156_COLTU|nr:MFS multidrug transporter [Colletotrichum truncatum]KAF6800489.1 MFS multidrug transporter [Colletotrichum truncatum]